MRFGVGLNQVSQVRGFAEVLDCFSTMRGRNVSVRAGTIRFEIKVLRPDGTSRVRGWNNCERNKNLSNGVRCCKRRRSI